MIDKVWSVRVRRGLITSAIVGSVLTLINQGPDIAAGHYPSVWQVVLTFMVPFLVTMVSSFLADRHRDKVDKVDKITS